jgi:2,3-bisphosphoglycerate-independent phosphoglycerate mutase
VSAIPEKIDFRVVLLFLDGVGIGKRDPEINPFFQAKLPTLQKLCGGILPHTPFKRISTEISEVIPLNATLGVVGLPQSGTGQTAIFTGVNGAKKFGRHFGPHPPSTLRPFIEEKNIFRQLQKKGKAVAFANAFPRQFFEYCESGKRRLTVTTLSCQYTGVPLRTAADLERNEGVSAEFVRSYWPELGHTNIPLITCREAGRHLAQISASYHFTLFEYWLTDHAGHSQKMPTAIEVLEHFDEFLAGYLELFDPQTTLLMLVSDHGNIEDLSTKSHTRNQVPCILAGRHRKKAAARLKDLTHITPTIVRLLKDQ